MQDALTSDSVHCLCVQMQSIYCVHIVQLEITATSSNVLSCAGKLTLAHAFMLNSNFDWIN